MFVRFIRLLLCLSIVAGGICGCANQDKQKEEAKKKEKQKEQKPKIPDMSGDMAFQSFVGRLRAAVARHDRATISSLMTADFGYRWDPAMAGETCFDYWDQHNIWPDLVHVLDQRFVPNGGYMVAPPDFANSDSYAGFRAGMRLINGGWRFAYFISGQDPMPDSTQ